MALFDFFRSSSSSSSSTTSTSPASSPPSTPLALQSSTPTPTSVELSSKHVTPLNPKGIKPCCACPETKIPRDDCFLRYGHEGSSQPATIQSQGSSQSEGEDDQGWRCRELVEEHRKCMSRLGFKI